MGIDEDIARYAAAAKRHGEATRAGDSEAANRAYRELDSCWRSIQMSETDWQPAFLELLEDESPLVRAMAAAYAIHFQPGRALPVLKVLAEEPGTLGFSAQMALKLWERGELMPPWQVQ
jgi:hypothetical protein